MKDFAIGFAIGLVVFVGYPIVTKAAAPSTIFDRLENIHG